MNIYKHYWTLMNNISVLMAFNSPKLMFDEIWVKHVNIWFESITLYIFHGEYVSAIQIGPSPTTHVFTCFYNCLYHDDAGGDDDEDDDGGDDDDDDDGDDDDDDDDDNDDNDGDDDEQWPSGVREAIFRPTGNGVLACRSNLFLSFFQAFLDEVLDSEVLIPLHNPPQANRAFRRADAENPHLAPLWRIMAEKLAFQEAFKKRSNFDSMSTLDFDPLGSILGSQNGFKIHPKSNKIGFPTDSCFCIAFQHRFLIDLASENGPPEPIRSSSRYSESTFFF